jgi:hypothetical protein
MKKILLTSIIVILVLVAGALGYLAFNANSLIAKNKPELERMASEAVGAKVTLGDISVSVIPSIKLNVSEFKVSGERKGEELSLKDLKLSVSLKEMLSGNIKITNLSISDPTILLIKERNQIRVAGLPEQKNNGDKAQSAERARLSSETEATRQDAPISLDLDSLSIEGLNVRIKNARSGAESAISRLNISTGIKFKENFISAKEILVQGTILKSGNISIKGNLNQLGSTKESMKLAGEITKLRLNEAVNLLNVLETSLPIEGDGDIGVKFEARGSTKAPTLDLNVDLTKAKIAKGGTFTKEAGVPLSLAINIKPENQGMVYSTSLQGDKISLVSPPTALSSLNLGIQAQQKAGANATDLITDSLSLNLGGAPVRGKIEASLVGSNTNLKSLHLDAFNGTIDGTANHNSDSGALSSDLAVATLDVAMLVSALTPAAPAPIAGTLSSLSLKSSTSLKRDPAAALSGRGSFILVNGKLLGVNIVAEVLKQIGALPFVNRDLSADLPPEEKEALKRKDTEIKQLSGSFGIANQTINTNDFFLQSQQFALTSAGQIGFDGNMNLKSNMILNKAISTVLVTKTKELKSAVNPKGELVLSVIIKGKSPNLSVMPDLNFLTKAALQGVVGKLLGGDKKPQGQAQSQSQGAPGAPAKKEQPNLKKILKF